MKNIDAIRQYTEAKTLLNRALFIAKTIKHLNRLTSISPATLTRIANGNYKASHATRARLAAFVDINANRRGRPFKSSTICKEK